MKSLIFTCVLFVAISGFTQSSAKFAFNWDSIKNNDKLPQREARWLKDSLSVNERTKVIDLVSALSRPAAAQLLVAHLYLDGSYTKDVVIPYIDSFAVRPPDADAGIIRVAYLVSVFRKKMIAKQATSKAYASNFTGATLQLPVKKQPVINKHIELSFDYDPATIVMKILSQPDISYNDICEQLAIHQFDELYEHHNQSFYLAPLNVERLALCLEKAASTQPVDVLYRYMHPFGLLNFTDVKNNLVQYQQLIQHLSEQEGAIFRHVQSEISDLLPATTQFKRKLSLFFINDATGWASGDVAAFDLNYLKDDYERLVSTIVHETYHSGQLAVAIKDTTQRTAPVRAFTDIIDYLFLEGTASYTAMPSVKTASEYAAALSEGTGILSAVYQNTIVQFNPEKAQKLSDEGISGNASFYWLGKAMSQTIVDVLGKEKLASIIPYGGIRFFKTYIDALNRSAQPSNLLSPELTTYITHLK